MAGHKPIKVYTQPHDRPKEFELLAEIEVKHGRLEPGWIDESVDDILNILTIPKAAVSRREAREVDGEDAYVLVMADEEEVIYEPGDIVSMADDPRLYIKNRAHRLSRLAELNAPMVLIENEYKLLTSAMEALRVKEGGVK